MCLPSWSRTGWPDRSVTITLADTPTGSVSVYTDFSPAVGKPCSPAQAAALDILRRTRREYGLPQQVEAVSVVQVEGGQS